MPAENERRRRGQIDGERLANALQTLAPLVGNAIGGVATAAGARPGVVNTIGGIANAIGGGIGSGVSAYRSYRDGDYQGMANNIAGGATALGQGIASSFQGQRAQAASNAIGSIGEMAKTGIDAGFNSYNLGRQGDYEGAAAGAIQAGGRMAQDVAGYVNAFRGRRRGRRGG